MTSIEQQRQPLNDNLNCQGGKARVFELNVLVKVYGVFYKYKKPDHLVKFLTHASLSVSLWLQLELEVRLGSHSDWCILVLQNGSMPRLISSTRDASALDITKSD